jgi:hypothetical protein
VALQRHHRSGRRHATITFKQDGESSPGNTPGSLGNADFDGNRERQRHSLHLSRSTRKGQPAPVTYDGTVEKNTMKGKLDIGGMVNGTFTATKK